MEKHLELSDDEFHDQFANTSMAPEIFSHEAHLRLAWIQIKRYDIEEAIKNVSEQIKKFAEHHGDAQKFNLTVTVAATRAVYHFMLKSNAENFQDFIHEHPRLKSNFKDLIEAHYSGNIFTSQLAKEIYLEPDLLPFDDFGSNKE